MTGASRTGIPRRRGIRPSLQGRWPPGLGREIPIGRGSSAGESAAAGDGVPAAMSQRGHRDRAGGRRGADRARPRRSHTRRRTRSRALHIGDRCGAHFDYAWSSLLSTPPRSRGSLNERSRVDKKVMSNPAVLRRRPDFSGARPDAGGGTRTPDTRIMIGYRQGFRGLKQLPSGKTRWPQFARKSRVRCEIGCEISTEAEALQDQLDGFRRSHHFGR
jgi:hypothetical protein